MEVLPRTLALTSHFLFRCLQPSHACFLELHMVLSFAHEPVKACCFESGPR